MTLVEATLSWGPQYHVEHSLTAKTVKAIETKPISNLLYELKL